MYCDFCASTKMQSNEARSCAGNVCLLLKNNVKTLALSFVVGVLRTRLASVSRVFCTTTKYLSQPSQDRCRSPLLDADLCRVRAAREQGRDAISLLTLSCEGLIQTKKMIRSHRSRCQLSKFTTGPKARMCTSHLFAMFCAATARAAASRSAGPTLEFYLGSSNTQDSTK
jgi:hypothetical protein